MGREQRLRAWAFGTTLVSLARLVGQIDADAPPPSERALRRFRALAVSLGPRSCPEPSAPLASSRGSLATPSRASLSDKSRLSSSGSAVPSFRAIMRQTSCDRRTARGRRARDLNESAAGTVRSAPGGPRDARGGACAGAGQSAMLATRLAHVHSAGRLDQELPEGVIQQVHLHNRLAADVLLEAHGEPPGCGRAGRGAAHHASAEANGG